MTKKHKNLPRSKEKKEVLTKEEFLKALRKATRTLKPKSAYGMERTCLHLRHGDFWVTPIVMCGQGILA